MAALEFGPQKIRINMISPGSTETPMAAAIVDDMAAGMAFTLDDNENATLLGRNAMPVDQANAFLFLASEEASSITGQNINVDSGMTIM